MVVTRPDASRGKAGLDCLVRAYRYGGDELLDPVADWLGYEKVDTKEVRQKEIGVSGDMTIEAFQTKATMSSPSSLPPSKSYLPWPFWRVTARTERTGRGQQSGPDWLLNGTSEPPPVPESHIQTVLPEQLVAMKHLWPMLINDLTHARKTSLPDVGKIIKNLALGCPMPSRLHKHRNRWAEKIHIIVDTSDHLFPFRADFMHLVEKMSDRIGSQRIQILRFTDFPGGPWEGWYLDDSAGDDVYSSPAEHGRVVILGDLDILKKGGKGSKGWVEFIKKLYHKKIQIFLFSPAAMQNYSPELQRMAALQPWDSRAAFSRHIGAARREVLFGPQPNELKELKVMLSCTSLFTPGLVRKLRMRFLPQSSAALETLIWEETDSFALIGSFAAWRRNQLEPFRQIFRGKNKQWKKEVLQIVTGYFKGFPADFLAVQQIIAGSLTGQSTEKAKQKLKTIMNAAWHRETDQSDLAGSFFRFFIDNQDPTDWHQDDGLLHTAFVVAYKKELEQGFPDKLPKGCDPDKISWLTPVRSKGFVGLLQQQNSLLCKYGQIAGPQDQVLVANCLVYTSYIPSLYRYKDQPWRSLKGSLEFFPVQQPLQIYTDREHIEITTFTKPVWADSIGRDQYGLFADLKVKGITQRFRWLEPNSFMMGAPEDESERYGDETQHKVNLSKGFWLADSTVTQEFWQLVMGKNPSGFKSKKRPVENVSWKDAQQFIKKLNKLVPELSIRLPSEAEWEYGCRAGTTTPFSFGDNITSGQVNYDSRSPYNDGKKDEYREQTVEVKTLPCNSWGLYEMHGNVLEWCQDWWQEDLGKDSVIDPQGPKKGEFRVLRGGSWFDDGGLVRSAIRGRFLPGFRINYFGFRLARGH